MNNNFIQDVKICPAFDKGYSGGIHGCDIRFVLKGKKGAVQFVLFTNWQLPQVTNKFKENTIKDEIDIKVRFLPLPADLGYHSPKPLFEGQTIMQNKCEYLDNQPCYYDGSGLQAEKVYDVMRIKGSDGVWEELEKYYIKTFGEDIPDIPPRKIINNLDGIEL